METKPLNRATLPAFERALGDLTQASSRRWGSLDAHRMLMHLRVTLEISTGERPGVDGSNFLTRFAPMRRLIVEVMPWPKGKIKAPDALTPAPEGTFEEERAGVVRAMHRFVDELEREPTRRTVSPGFGTLPMSYWSILHGRHIAHHLEQFGEE